MFPLNLDALSPWDGSATNGFRCAKYTPGDTLPASVTRPPQARFRDYSKETPVSEEIFKVLLSSYLYDRRADLKPIVEAVEDVSEYWRREKISFNAGDGN